MTRLRLALLGGLDARLDQGGLVALARPKVEALLAFLAIRPGQVARREDLASLLWADVPGPRARQSLRQALAELRRALSPVPGCLIEQGDTVALDPETADVDVARFERLLADTSTEALEHAVSLYRGDLLEGLRVVEPRFEEWLMSERERLRELAQEALTRLLAGYLEADVPGRAVDAALRLVALDPLEESTHRTLMRLYLRLGRRGAGLRQYQLSVDLLRRELGAAPEEETRRLYLELLQADAATTPAIDAASPERRAIGADALHDAPLLGRETELTRLRQAFDDARRGDCDVIAVFGEAGIGKSRLLAELAATLGPESARVLIGRAHESESHLPFGPWVQAFRDGGMLADMASHLALHPVWRAELARLFPELAEPGGRSPETAADYTGLFEAVAHVLTTLAQPALLLVLEDLHWADDLSLRLLAFVSRRVKRGAIVAALSAREEELANSPTLRQILTELQHDGRVVELRLSPLSRDTTLALVGALSRSGMEPSTIEKLGAEIQQVSDGNPFMVVETMRALQDGAAAVALGSGLPFPARVRDTVGRRLDRLSDHGRRLAGVAATIGRAFDFAILQRSAGLGPAETAEAVEDLVGRRILHAVGERLDFTHQWIRRTAYERLLPPLRRLQHEAIVKALEAQHAGRLEDVYDQLAYHASRAGEPARAVTHLRSFADVASRRYAIDEAIRALREALDHVDRLPEPDQARARIFVSLELSVALSVVGRFEAILDLLSPLAASVDQIDQPALVGAYFSRVALTESILGRQAHAEEAARRALAEAERCADHRSLGTAHYVLATKGFVVGQAIEGILHGRHSIAWFERTKDRAWLSQACWMLGLNHYLAGEFEPAVEAVSRMETLARELGDRGRRATAAWTFALIDLTRGELDAARRSAREAIEHSPDASNMAAAEAILGMADAEDGEPARAISMLTRAHESLARFPQRLATTLVFLGEAHRLAGHLDDAETIAHRALATSREISFTWAIAAAERSLGRTASMRGDDGAATRHLRPAFDLFAAIPARFELGRTHLDLASVLRNDAGARPEAAAHLRNALRFFTDARAFRYVERAERLAEELGISLPPGAG